MRRLNPEEAALWAKVVATVRPLHNASPVTAPEAAPLPPPQRSALPAAPPVRAAARAAPGTTLDASWDRRLSRGLVAPDAVLDLHGHNLATAYDLLDRRLDQAIARGDRLLLLITGKAPRPGSEPGRRGAIRAAVGDWLAASRHAAAIAAVRSAHPTHGGAGALYIILRRKR